MAGRASINISITHIPEALAGMRCEVARILRDIAKAEDEKVAHRLVQVADAFEAGQRPGVDNVD